MYTINKCAISHSGYQDIKCVSCNIELDIKDHYLIQTGNDIWSICNTEICINMCILQRSSNV